MKILILSLMLLVTMACGKETPALVEAVNDCPSDAFYTLAGGSSLLLFKSDGSVNYTDGDTASCESTGTFSCDINAKTLTMTLTQNASTGCSASAPATSHWAYKYSGSTLVLKVGSSTFYWVK